MKDKDTEQVILDLIKSIQSVANKVTSDTNLTREQKFIQADVVLNTLHFLKDYDKNVNILDKYWKEQNRKDKFNKSMLDIER